MEIVYRDGTTEQLSISNAYSSDGEHLIVTDEIGVCARRRMADIAEIRAC